MGGAPPNTFHTHSRPRNTAASGNLAFTTSQASTPKLYISSLSMHETWGEGKLVQKIDHMSNLQLNRQ